MTLNTITNSLILLNKIKDNKEAYNIKRPNALLSLESKIKQTEIIKIKIMWKSNFTLLFYKNIKLYITVKT